MACKSLVDFRNKLHLTQTEMARTLGITLSSYSKIELGMRNPSYNFLEKLKRNFSDFDVNIFFSDNYTLGVDQKDQSTA